MLYTGRRLTPLRWHFFIFLTSFYSLSSKLLVITPDIQNFVESLSTDSVDNLVGKSHYYASKPIYISPNTDWIKNDPFIDF